MKEGTAAVGARIDQLRIDFVQRKAFMRDQPLKLTDLSYRFLLALVDAGGEPVSIKALTDEVWPQQVSGDAVKQQARTLRLAIELDAANPKYIESVRGFGYRMAGSIETIHDEPIKSRFFVRRRLLATVLAITVLVPGAVWFASKDSRSTSGWRFAAPAISPIGEGNWTVDLAAGLDAELSTALIDVGGLHLISDLGGMRSGDFVAATARDAYEVDFALTGAVRFDQDQSRVVFELVDCRTGSVLAARAFDLQLGLDVQAQSKLAVEVANFVREHLAAQSTSA